jgi:signal transduction histidine kinase
MLVLEAIADDETRFSISKRLWIAPGERQISLREVATPLHDRAGNVRGAVVAFWDRSQEQAGERAKVDIVNEVAHELGNKLGVIILAAQRILGGKLSAKRREEYKQVFADLLTDLQSFHQRLTTLQHERVREDIEETEIDLEEQVQHRVALLKAAKTGRRFKVGGDFDFVRADAERLAVVLENVLGNAVKYAPRGSQIRIRSKCPTSDTLVLSIHNRGEPIPEEFKPHLFEPWQRANSIKPGSGLGLWLVRTKLREMGGEIEFESSARGGTTFFITLKRKVHALPKIESDKNSQSGPDSARKEET